MIQETSKQSYLEIIGSGRMNEMQEVIFKAFLINPLSTDKEISEKTGEEINIVTARRNELVAKGLIKEAGKRICKVTGYTSITWHVCNEKAQEETTKTSLTDTEMANLGKRLLRLKEHGNDFQKNKIIEWVEKCL